MIQPLSAELLAVHAVKAVIVMLVLLVGFRLLGKRQIAQLNLYDLAMIMAVSNAVQNAMTGGLGNLSIGIVTSTAVVLLAWFATRVFVRAPKLEDRFIGSPSILLNHGRILKHRLARERISREELMAALRAHGLTHPSQVRIAILEVNGSISVVPKKT